LEQRTILAQPVTPLWLAAKLAKSLTNVLLVILDSLHSLLTTKPVLPVLPTAWNVLTEQTAPNVL
jgi:hypothetical protein